MSSDVIFEKFSKKLLVASYDHFASLQTQSSKNMAKSNASDPMKEVIDWKKPFKYTKKNVPKK